ncbi:hypothetical protein [Streptomyces sp. NPDC054794]
MKSEFLARLSEEMLEYYRDMAEVLVEHCGIGRAEAVARINQAFGDEDAPPEDHEIMGHEFPEFWAYGAYYLADDQGRLPIGDPDVDAYIDFAKLPIRPAPPKGSPCWTLGETDA